MESKVFYIKRLLSTLGICVIGLILSQTVLEGFGLYNGSALITAFLFAGMPFGWMEQRKIFGGIVVWGLWGILIYYVCLIAFSFAIGWMTLAFRRVRDTVQLINAGVENVQWHSDSRHQIRSCKVPKRLV